MAGRTYRYMTEEPLYPFGFGLSYTKFEYSNLKLGTAEIEVGKNVVAKVTVKNTGNYAAEEVVQLYITDVQDTVEKPAYALKGFKRVRLKPGRSQTVAFTITPEMMSIVNENGASVIDPGQFMITIGGCSPGQRGIDLGAPEPVQASFSVM
jgi:beta-glucosidase